jgi:transcriptional regulator with XRE-family HTH domain
VVEIVQGDLDVTSTGALVRAWRMQTGCSQSEIAAVVGVTSAAVSSWELGTYRVPASALEKLDVYFAAGGCLVDLARAMGTPGGFLAPRRCWGHLYPRGLGSRWVWVRPAHGSRVDAYVYSGLLGIPLGGEAGPGGLFTIPPGYDSRWPVFVVLDEPGWVDFGRGVPPTWLSGTTEPGGTLEGARFTQPRDLQISFFIDEFRRRDRGDPRTLRDRLRHLSTEPWDAFEASYPQMTDSPFSPALDLSFSDARPPGNAEQRRVLHRRLRQARDMSQSEVAEQASCVLAPGAGSGRASRVSLHQIHNYEAGRVSRVPYLPAVLDTVYGGFGWSCRDSVPVRRDPTGGFEVAFPGFWEGPVCVSVVPSAPYSVAGEVAFAWGQWKLARHMPGHPVTFRFCRVCDDPPLSVRVPPGWAIEAHMGQDPDALDANSDWVPADRAAGDEIFHRYTQAWLALLGKTRADLDLALGISR